MRVTSKLAASCVAWFALVGCASDLFEGKYAFSAGWRKGTVLRVEHGGAIENPRFWACLRHVPVAAAVSQSYALVEYHQSSRHRKHLVPAPANMQLRPGDKVYVNLSTCDDAIVRRGSGSEERS